MEDPQIEFSQVETLLWTLHQLGKKHNAFLTNQERAEDVKEFKKRLQYMARVIQVYSKKLRGALQGKSKEEAQKEEVLQHFNFVLTHSYSFVFVLIHSYL